MTTDTIPQIIAISVACFVLVLVVVPIAVYLAKDKLGLVYIIFANMTTILFEKLAANWLTILVFFLVGLLLKLVSSNSDAIIDTTATVVRIIVSIINGFIDVVGSFTPSIPEIASYWNKFVTFVYVAVVQTLTFLCDEYPPVSIEQSCPTINTIFETIGDIMLMILEIFQVLIEMATAIFNVFGTIVCDSTFIKVTKVGGIYKKQLFSAEPGKFVDGYVVQSIPYCRYVCGDGVTTDKCWGIPVFIQWIVECIIMYIIYELMPMWASGLNNFALLGGYPYWSDYSRGGSEDKALPFLLIMMKILQEPYRPILICVGIIANFALAWVDRIYCSVLFFLPQCVIYPACKVIFGWFCLGLICADVSSFCMTFGSNCACTQCTNPFFPVDTSPFAIGKFPCQISTSCNCRTGIIAEKGASLFIPLGLLNLNDSAVLTTSLMVPIYSLIIYFIVVRIYA